MELNSTRRAKPRLLAGGGYFVALCSSRVLNPSELNFRVKLKPHCYEAS